MHGVCLVGVVEPYALSWETLLVVSCFQSSVTVISWALLAVCWLFRMCCVPLVVSLHKQVAGLPEVKVSFCIAESVFFFVLNTIKLSVHETLGLKTVLSFATECVISYQIFG